MSKRTLVLMCSIFLVVPLLFMGCGSGSDGATGAQGPQGQQGPPGDNGATGPAGPTTSTNEACMVCHTTGRVADISDSNPASITHYNANYEKPSVTISGLTVSNVAGKPKVDFHMAFTSGGAPVTNLAKSALRLYIADLVPANTATTQGTWSSDLFEIWASERDTTAGNVFDNTNAATGDYSYTFATGFGDNVALANAPEYDPTHIQRLVVRYSGGGVVNNAVVSTSTNNAVGVVDFTVPAAGASTTGIGYNARQFVTVEACKQCHGPLLAGAAHGGSYGNAVNVFTCNICHTPIGNEYGPEMVEGQAWAINFYHKIHSAIAMPEWASRIGGKGYGAVTYPQDVRNCVTCHTTSGADLGLGNQVDNWKNHPTAAACGSCHETAFAAINPTHTGGNQPDTACSFCHPATGHVNPALGASVTEAHDTSATAALHPNAKNVPEFDVTFSLSAPANGTHYLAGDNVTVTATLNFHGGAAIPGSMYTAAQGANGVADNLLRTASLYVYGPRAMPKPILGAQSNSLFVGASANVATDNTGFKYNMTIPSGLASGTYLARVRFADYGYVAATNYKVESIGFTPFQIGTATVSKKVAGDACVNCHGNGTAPFHDARHIVAWDTDECISCHDYSGGHAAALSNRVHAVHSASQTGDMLNEWDPIAMALVTPLSRDWSDVTYPLGLGWPGGIGRCDICHTSGNTSYRSVTHEVSCLGCHGDRTGATDHMLQNGGKYPATP